MLRRSAEAEYRSLAVAMSEMIWLRQLAMDLQKVSSTQSVIYCGSQTTLHITSNPTYHERTKQIEIDLHFIRDHFGQAAFD